MSTFIDMGDTYETRRYIPPVDEDLADALGRPAQAHVLVEVWQDYYEFPDWGGSPRPIKGSRRIATRREEVQR